MGLTQKQLSPSVNSEQLIVKRSEQMGSTEAGGHPPRHEPHDNVITPTPDHKESRCPLSAQESILMNLRGIEAHIREQAFAEYESQNKFSRLSLWRFLPDRDKDKQREKKIRSAVVSRKARRTYQRFLEMTLLDIEDKNKKQQELIANLRREINLTQQFLSQSVDKEGHIISPPDVQTRFDQRIAYETSSTGLSPLKATNTCVFSEEREQWVSADEMEARNNIPENKWQYHNWLQIESIPHDHCFEDPLIPPAKYLSPKNCSEDSDRGEDAIYKMLMQQWKGIPKFEVSHPAPGA